MILCDNQKRWVVFGVALNKVLVAHLRPFVEQEIQKEYGNLQTSHNIHTQSYRGRLQKHSVTLKYENINGNDTQKLGGKYDYPTFNYQVTSYIDFAKLYVENHMAKFNAFDEHCDASALLALLGKVPVFPAAVQTAAGNVRQARNSWAHCEFGEWDPKGYQQSFDAMKQLVKKLGLPIADENALIKELEDWERKGAILCMNATIDPDLVRAVQQDLIAVKNDVDNLAFEKGDEGAQLKTALQDAVGDLKELEKRVSKVEQEQESLTAKVQDQIIELRTEQVNVQRRVERLEGKQCLTEPQICIEIASCEAEITEYARRYDPDTRKWFFEDFNKWFGDPGDSRAYVLLGDAGVGKSVLAGALAHQTRNAGNLAAAYFCHYNDATRNNPRYLLGTIACQLCKCNELYNILVKGEVGISTCLGNSALGVHELFTKLLQEPLAQCTSSDPRKLLVIDALDETDYESREDFLDLIMHRFPILPQWLVFFITSRPEDCVQFRLKRYNPCIKICAGNSEDVKFYQQHEQDIKLYLEKTVNFTRLPYSVDDVAKKCSGLFLYAFYVKKALKDQENSGKISQLDELIPRDIESFFLQNFRRIFDKVGADLYRKLFGCTIAAPSPLPLSFISFILKRENSSLEEQEIIDALSTFLLFCTPDQTFTFLHNLIPAWLTNKEKASRKRFVDRSKAGEYFRDLIISCLSEFLDEQSDGSISIDTHVLDYILRVGVRYLLSFSGKVSQETTYRCLTSFKFMQARIQCRRNGIYSLIEDVKRGAGNETIYCKKQVLQEMCSVLERNAHVLSECPKLLNSCLQMTSKAFKDIIFPCGVSTFWMEYNFLRNPLHEIPLGISCFALSPDKVWLAGAKGQSIFLFDACTLEKIQGPVEVEEPENVIQHVEFSLDSKFLFFGRLDKWFSLDLGRLKEFPQFAGRDRFFKWGSLALQGRYIVVEGDNFWSQSHVQSCMINLFCLWATLELKQIKGDELVCMRELIQLWIRLFTQELFQKLFQELFQDSFRRSRRRSRSSSNLIVEFVRECSKVSHNAKLCRIFLCDVYETSMPDLCSLCSSVLEQRLLDTALPLVRQRIIDLYPDIFPYQVWNLESGRSALEEAFSASTQLNPLFFIYHLPDSIALNGRPSLGKRKEVPLCGIAVAYAMHHYHFTSSYYFDQERDVSYFPKLVPLNPYFLTHSPNEIPGVNTAREIKISLDQNWLAVGTNHDFEVTVFKKISQSEHFDYENSVHVIKDVHAFAFTDDCRVLLYLTKHESYHALSLQTGTAFSSVSGLIPQCYTLEEKVGYCFRNGCEESSIFVRDLPSDFLECVWASLDYKPPLEMAFSSSDTIKSIRYDATLSSWKITDVDVPSFVTISEERLMDGKSLLREDKSLENCVFSHCGKLLAVQRSEAILLFNHAEFTCNVFEEEGCSISCMNFSADSTLLLLCIEMNKDLGRKFLMWDIQKGALSASCDSIYLPSIECCCFSSDNAKVIICGQLSIQIWECTDHPCRLLATLAPSGFRSELDKFAHCTVSSNDKLLACCIGDKILLYPLTRQQSGLQIPHCHLGRVDFCQFLKGTRYLISYGVDGVVFLWHLNDWQAVAYARITLGKESITRIALSPDEDKVVCLTSFGRLSLITLCGLQSENVDDLPLLTTNAIGIANHSPSREQLKERRVPTFQGSASYDNLDISTDDWLLLLSSDENEVDSDED